MRRVSGYYSSSTTGDKQYLPQVLEIETRHLFSMRMAKKWVETCHHGHRSRFGQAPQPLLLDRQVINCSTREMWTRSVDRTYVALSYVWSDCAAGNQARIKLPIGLFPKSGNCCIKCDLLPKGDCSGCATTDFTIHRR
jgi:hypothetical protein